MLDAISMRSRCDLDAISIRSRCDLDAISMRSRCDLDAEGLDATLTSNPNLHQVLDATMRVQAERRVERRNGDEEDNLGDQRYGPPMSNP